MKTECLAEEKDGIFFVKGGAIIENAITEAIALAEKKDRVVKFKFNAKIVCVLKYSDPVLILRDFHLSSSGDNIDPHPVPSSQLSKREQDEWLEIESSLFRMDNL